MRTERNILIAFLLNVFFSIFELIGGIFTNSVAIISDAIHDLGDAISIGFAYFLEKKSKRKPDDKYTYGYARYSVLGATITNTILIIGSSIVIYNAVNRIINPVSINYDGMIIFAIIGAVVNFIAAYFTREGDSLNQKAVNLHMLEDVMGWVIVLVGAIFMKFTNISIIDPILSIVVAIFILINALKSCKAIIDLFLLKIPGGISVEQVKNAILDINGIKDVHHIHIWSMDGFNNYVTLHVVIDKNDMENLKIKIKRKLQELDVVHSVIECEGLEENCIAKECCVNQSISSSCCHHHHHNRGKKNKCSDNCCRKQQNNRTFVNSQKNKKYWYNPSENK